jgi:hypothetical protein
MSFAPFAATRLAAVGTAIVLAVVAAAGCGSSSGSSGGASSAGGGSSGRGSSGGAASGASGSAPGASPSMAVVALSAAAVGQIRSSYETLFQAGTDPARAVTVLQHGDQLRAALAANAKSPQARGLTVQVTKVVRDPSNPNVARTTFTLLSGGAPVLPGTAGYAVKEKGRWKVAATTFCQLLSLQQAAPAQCHDASITAFPSG